MRPISNRLLILEYFESQLAGLSEGAPTDERIKSLLEIGRIQVERYKGADAWEKAFTAFNLAQEDEYIFPIIAIKNILVFV
jgi:hypothetical protein